MCIGHLYGVVLYYSTSLTELYFNGVSHSRPEFLYFWVYYVGFNGPWVVVPTSMSTLSSSPRYMTLLIQVLVLLVQSVLHIKGNLEDHEKMVAKLNKINGIMGDKSWQTYVPQEFDEKKNE